MDTLLWLLKVNVAIILLYTFYKLFFQQDTFFNVKRVILLLSLFFSLVYPFFDVKELFLSKTPNLEENLLAFQLPEFLVLSGAEKTPQTMPVVNIINAVWLIGVIGLLLYFVFQIISVFSKILTSKRTRILGMNVYVLKGLKTPFSFFNYILIDPDFHDEQDLSEILHHEKTHTKQGHTWDVIFSELFCILCWFNPFAWLIKKEIRINLEFLADNFVMKSVKNTEHYQLHLLRLSYHKAIAQLSNNFNVSPLKKRIQMMNRKKSSGVGIIKYALFVPLFVALSFVNNLQAQAKDNEKQSQNSQVAVIEETANVNKDVFTQVDHPPQFPGGDKGIMNYLSQNIKYPIEAQKKKIEGMVVLRFVVNKTGEVTDVTILRSLSPETDEEATRVVSAMPKWIPGKQGGKEVDVYYTLPIQFKLSLQENPIEILEDESKVSELPSDVVYIVNGKIVSQEVVSKIPPADIESVEVFKKSETNPENKVILTLKKDRISF